MGPLTICLHAVLATNINFVTEIHFYNDLIKGFLYKKLFMEGSKYSVAFLRTQTDTNGSSTTNTFHTSLFVPGFTELGNSYM